MLRKFTLPAVLSCSFAGFLFAQGLNTQASKDDWEEINFEFNSAALSDGYPSLLRLADLLNKNPAYRVKVEGHTDNLGADQYNDKLGRERANTVRDFLVKYGAKADQIEVATRGKSSPEVQGYKRHYSKTDVARWINRRVVLTVTDQNGRTVSAGGVGAAISAIDQGAARPGLPCCDDILKRLDKLDDIARMLRELTDQNAGLRREIDTLKSQQAALDNKVNALPKPLSEQQTAQVVEQQVLKARDPKFALLGLNVGADDRRDITFTGKGRFFAPFRERFAVQIEGEYLYFKSQQEGQGDIGLVARPVPSFQAGLFASFKHVNLRGAADGGNLGQGAVTLDWLFGRGKLGVFGTKGFMNTATIDTRNLQFISGANADGTARFSTAPNLFVEQFLRVVDQAGVSTTLGLWGNTYVEANVGYLRSFGHADRPGGTVRFVFPWGSHFAFTVEGGVNETLLNRTNAGRAVVGFQVGNLLRPKDYMTVEHPVPAQIPRLRYELLTRTIHRGVSPPVADAGPDQIGVPAGTITLNGSNSHDPNGEQLSFQWVQESGPAVAISGANQPIATFQAAAGQAFSFRLTVRNTDGQTASARVRITTRADRKVNILFFTADPSTIQAGQSSTLAWRVLNATTVTITPDIGSVNPTNGTVSVSPKQTTTYRLHASNATSQEDSTVTVTVQQPQVQIPVCTATPMNIVQGGSATLFFQTLNADTVTITPGIGGVAKNGSVVVSPSTTTTFTITAANAFGSTSCTVTVQVTPGAAPTILRFTAAPLNIQAGGTSTLLWAVQNATKVTITPDVGDVDAVGTRDVKPTQTTTYTLTASNSFGQVTAQTTVTVTPAPPPVVNPAITSFTANPTTSPSPGSPVTLTCTATNATQVAISGVGVVNQNGQIVVNPQATTTYVCVATGSNGAQASANLTVPVTTPTGGTPPVVVVGGLSGATCTPASGGGTTICQTVVRTVQLDLTGSTSAAGAGPLTFFTQSRNSSAVVLNPTSPTPNVQLSELFGDYFFDITVTDSKGNKTTVTVDVQLVVTRVREPSARN
jgi:hypothetical protein